MKRRSLWLSGIAGVLAVALLAVALDPAARVPGWVAGEPFYRDRAASAWQRDLASSKDAERNVAVAALVAGKAEAVPVCVWLLEKASQPEVRFRAAEILGQVGEHSPAAGPALVAALADADGMVREMAIISLSKLAPEVPGAVPALVKLFPKDLAIRAVGEFGAVGVEAVPRLIPLLTHPEAKTRENAARTLGLIGEPALAAVPELLTQMEKDTDPVVRAHAAEALGAIGPKAAGNSAVVPALAKALKDRDARVTLQAVRALGTMGEAAKPVLSDVIELNHDTDPRLKDASRKAAGRIDTTRK